MKNPKISIIIPVYNGSDYVAEAIESALAQDYPNFEVIVINDGSKDEGATDKICRSFGSKIRYYKKPNGGVASALNKGVREMKGEYFSWLSHDDLYFPYKLSKEVALIKKSPPKTLIYSNYEEVDQNSNHLNFSKLKDIKSDKFLAALVKDRFLHGCTLLIPRVAFKEAGLFDLALRNTQDYDLWFRLIKKHWQFKLCPEVLVKSRKHNKQTSIATSGRQRMEDDTLYAKILQNFSARNLTSNKSVTLGLMGLAVDWQFWGFSGAASQAFKQSLKYIQPSDYFFWTNKVFWYHLLKVFALPLRRFLVFGARLKRWRKAKPLKTLKKESKIKICFIGRINSSHNLKTVNYCLKQGYEVHFVSLWPGRIKGVKLYYCLRHRFEPKFIWFIRAAFTIKKIIRQIQPSLVQGQYLSSGGILAYISGFRPYIIGILGSDVLRPLPLSLNILSYFAIRKAVWVITSSELLCKSVINFGAKASQVSVIPFGIDLKLFKPGNYSNVRKKLSIKPNDKIIFSPRAINRIYNIITIINALDLIKDSNVKLALINQPVNRVYFQEVQSLIDRKQLSDRIIWLKPVENTKMPDYYNLADVVVSIPVSEGMGASVYEAMACQKKIVKNRLPVFKEWERDKNFFITKLNPQDLKKKILQALTTPEEKFTPIGRLNRKLVQEKADLEHTFDGLDQIYNNVMDQ